ncbi:cyclopropane-fatty-acyl-phospholipid synthase family protein [Parvibaculum sp.]|jgi:cyclopropane fatty-acyl-phospholipid synthase-like methyltransferase|uniref:SAM-dependent methyltransferase n=1 Tax=Parvibaculum sp. TaxID=2024848 RepID=UPI0025DACB66|nr:class I SAM-dependent methyltransferase [Parvibaculum sp.]|tara:strand:+ start:8898 stop:10223 length:1326 start_codon:yes stop_codon:yes gene_type:complete
MSNSALVNLATVGSDELQAMPMSVFTANLEHMSAEAVVRFRRMRKLSASQRSAVEKILAEKSGGRPGPSAAERDSAKQPSDKADKKKPKEAGFCMEILLRAIAWWEGMETDDVARAKGIKRRRKKKKAPAAKQIQSPAPAASAPSAAEEPPISLSRLEIIQKLWGEGHSLPGGADFALRIARSANFKRRGRFLDLSPGLGGGMRAVAAKYNVSILGIERDHELAAEAQRLSQRQEMLDQAPVHACGPAGFERADFNPAGGHSAIFMREAMFRFPDREWLLNEMRRGLEEDGALVLTDFVLAEGVGTDEPEAPALAAWRISEGHIGTPWTETEYREALAAQDYKVESFEDLTSVYLPHIQSAWRQLHDCLQKAKLLPETATRLMEEGAIWLARSQALETKQLRLVLIHASRGSAADDDEEQPDETDFIPESTDEADGQVSRV